MDHWHALVITAGAIGVGSTRAQIIAYAGGSPSNIVLSLPVTASVGGRCGFAPGQDFPFTLECAAPFRAAVISHHPERLRQPGFRAARGRRPGRRRDPTADRGPSRPPWPDGWSACCRSRTGRCAGRRHRRRQAEAPGVGFEVEFIASAAPKSPQAATAATNIFQRRNPHLGMIPQSSATRVKQRAPPLYYYTPQIERVYPAPKREASRPKHQSAPSRSVGGAGLRLGARRREPPPNIVDYLGRISTTPIPRAL